MLLLAIDTCGAVGGVALGELAADLRSQNREPSTGSGQALGHPVLEYTCTWSRELAGKTSSERLLSTVAETLSDAKSTLGDLSGIVVVHGPGSFTGIRNGVSAAKGLAEGLAVPVIAISRLELLARKAADGSAVAVLDAGRGEFYAGFYRNAICQAEALLTRVALSEAMVETGLSVLACEPQVIAALADFNPRLMAAPTALDALAVGVERFRAGVFDDISTLDANYLRRSETEMLTRIAEHAAQRVAAQATPS